MVKNGGPDLKWARHTGLSARRAGMAKSRGPKGLQLEVGPRSGPRLLVIVIIVNVIIAIVIEGIPHRHHFLLLATKLLYSTAQEGIDGHWASRVTLGKSM